jgi:hypothetical protein
LSRTNQRRRQCRDGSGVAAHSTEHGLGPSGRWFVLTREAFIRRSCHFDTVP